MIRIISNETPSPAAEPMGSADPSCPTVRAIAQNVVGTLLPAPPRLAVDEDHATISESALFVDGDRSAGCRRCRVYRTRWQHRHQRIGETKRQEVRFLILSRVPHA